MPCAGFLHGWNMTACAVLEEMKRRREAMAGPSSSPAALPPGSLVSVTTPLRAMKKQALHTPGKDDELQQPVKKSLFQAWGMQCIHTSCMGLPYCLSMDATHIHSATPETPSPEKQHVQQASTGGQDDDDETAATLRSEIARLKAINRDLQAEVEQLRAAPPAQPLAVEAPEHEDELGADALRKRLSRLCERKRNGFLGFMLTCMCVSGFFVQASYLGKLGGAR